MPDLDMLDRAIADLVISCRKADIDLQTLYLIDNGPGEETEVQLSNFKEKVLENDYVGEIEVISGQGNVGYGSGHNLAIASIRSDLHLIMNPDIFTGPDAIGRGVTLLENTPDVGMVVPVAEDEQGRNQYLAKRYPDLLTLAIRAFCPRCLHRFFHSRLKRYELRGELCGQEPVLVELASGCFMLARTPLLQSLKGFDESFFMYFEDYDLSMRFNQVSKIAQLPDMKIIHLGGGAAKKGARHIAFFVRSACRFFSRYGWKFY